MYVALSIEIYAFRKLFETSSDAWLTPYRNYLHCLVERFMKFSEFKKFVYEKEKLSNSRYQPPVKYL